MFFILSKTLGALTVPSNVLIAFMLIGFVLLFTRWARAGQRLLIVCVAVFLVVGAMPVGSALTAALENRFPAWVETAAPPDGIIILGGPVKIGISRARGTVELDRSAERFTAIPALARRYPNARIVFTGGSGRLTDNAAGEFSEAPFAVRLLESIGIPRERILVEGRSRNTAENASFTKTLVRPKPGERWLLVTSAAHMPRSVASFRGVGFPVEPYPVDWQTDGRRRPWWRWLVPSLGVIGGWGRLDDAAKEWVGLVAYRLAGHTTELFPAPRAPNPAAAGRGDRRP
jgi:uncharacterized SAM-binding protein YcdF (DUF218 family)